MPASPSRFRQFRADIRRLIAEIENCMHARPQESDREYSLQVEVFEERCNHAERLAQEIAKDEQTLWGLRDGDARRLQDSLRLSLDYFRPEGRSDG
ncbi:MAG: hypothetical protein HKN81_01370 [Gammaproteobacteria bacterium]|nr:hypothetical protein [Gammaproteobacteria bacterium]